jgi:hypothetical protein
MMANNKIATVSQITALCLYDFNVYWQKGNMNELQSLVAENGNSILTRETVEVMYSSNCITAIET